MSAVSAQAAHADPAPAKVELGLEGATLNDNLGYWEGVYGLVSFDVSSKDRLSLELAYLSRFAEQGFALGGTWQRNYSEDSYQVSSLNGSSSGIFLPSSGISSEYFHKLGSERNWILGGGGGADFSRTGNHDFFGVLELIRYFSAGWVAEAGTRLNLGEPGAVTALRGFAALSWLPAEGYEFVFKLDGGGEAYQLVGEDQVVSSFNSLGISGEAFVPIGGGRQLHGRVEVYTNPIYERGLGYLGISQTF